MATKAASKWCEVARHDGQICQLKPGHAEAHASTETGELVQWPLTSVELHDRWMAARDAVRRASIASASSFAEALEKSSCIESARTSVKETLADFRAKEALSEQLAAAYLRALDAEKHVAEAKPTCSSCLDTGIGRVGDPDRSPCLECSSSPRLSREEREDAAYDDWKDSRFEMH